MAFVNDIPILQTRQQPLHEEDGQAAPDPGIMGQPQPRQLPLITSKQLDELTGESGRPRLTTREAEAFGLIGGPPPEERQETLSAALGVSNNEFGPMASPDGRATRKPRMSPQEVMEQKTKALLRPGNAWELTKIGAFKPEVSADAPELKQGEFPIETAHALLASGVHTMLDVITKIGISGVSVVANAAESMSEPRQTMMIQRKASERNLNRLQQASDQASADVMAQAGRPGGPDQSLVKKADEARQVFEMAAKLVDPSVSSDYKDRVAPIVREWLTEKTNQALAEFDEFVGLTPEVESSFAGQVGSLAGGIVPYVLLAQLMAPLATAGRIAKGSGAVRGAMAKIGNWLARNAPEIGSAAAGMAHTASIAYEDARSHGAPPAVAELYAAKLAPTGAADLLVPRALLSWDKQLGGKVLPAVRRAINAYPLENFRNRTAQSAIEGMLGGLLEGLSYDVLAKQTFDPGRDLMQSAPMEASNRAIAGAVLSAIGGFRPTIRGMRGRAAVKGAYDYARSGQPLTADAILDPEFVSGFYANMPRQAIDELVRQRKTNPVTSAEEPPSRKAMTLLGIRGGPDVTADVRQRFSEEIRKLASESTLRDGVVEISADDILQSPLVEHLPEDSVRRLAALPEIKPEDLQAEGLTPDQTVTPSVLQDMHVRAQERAATGEVTPRPERVEVPVRDEEVASAFPERLAPPSEPAEKLPQEVKLPDERADLDRRISEKMAEGMDRQDAFRAAQDDLTAEANDRLGVNGAYLQDEHGVVYQVEHTSSRRGGPKDLRALRVVSIDGKPVPKNSQHWIDPKESLLLARRLVPAKPPEPAGETGGKWKQAVDEATSRAQEATSWSPEVLGWPTREQMAQVEAEIRAVADEFGIPQGLRERLRREVLWLPVSPPPPKAEAPRAETESAPKLKPYGKLSVAAQTYWRRRAQRMWGVKRRDAIARRLGEKLYEKMGGVREQGKSELGRTRLLKVAEKYKDLVAAEESYRYPEASELAEMRPEDATGVAAYGFDFSDTPSGRSHAKTIRDSFTNEYKHLKNRVTIGNKGKGETKGDDMVSRLGEDVMARMMMNWDDGHSPVRREQMMVDAIEKNWDRFSGDAEAVRAYIEYRMRDADFVVPNNLRTEDIQTSVMRVGDEVKIAGDTYRVTGEQDGQVKLEDGIKVEVPIGADLKIDKGTHKAGEGETFGQRSESERLRVSEEESRAEQEGRQADESGEGDTSFEFGASATRRGAPRVDLTGEYTPATGQQQSFGFKTDINGFRLSESGWIGPDGKIYPDYKPDYGDGPTLFTHEMREGGTSPQAGSKIPNIANIGEADTGPAEVSAWAQKRFPGLKHAHALKPADVFWLQGQLTGNDMVLGKMHDNVVAAVRAGRISPQHGARLQVVINSLYKPNDPHTLMGLMHELGHIIDILPSGVLDLKRGTILNHIKATIGETGRFMKEYPGSPFDVITRDDVKRLRNEARRIARKKMPVEEVPEFVVTRLKVAAKDILDVFNRLTWDHLPKDLVDYIKRMSNREKALAVKAAMESAKQGTDLPPEFDRFTKETKTPTGKVFKRRAKPSAGDMKQQFQDLLTAEIEKRRLFDGHLIRKELLALSRYWRPDERPGGESLAAKARPIDRSAKEIYADGVMSLLFAPNETKSRAPHFWDAFWNYLDARPNVAEALIETQGLLSHSANDWRVASQVYRDRALTSMKNVGDLFLAAHNSGPMFDKSILHRVTMRLASVWKDSVQSFVEKYSPIRAIARRETKKYGPRSRAQQEYAYRLATQIDADGFTKALAIEYDRIWKNARKRGVSFDDLTIMLKSEWILAGRRDVWNPQLWDADEATRQLNLMKERLSPDQWQKLQDARSEIHEMVFSVLQRALEEGYISEGMFDALEKNKDAYASFMAAEYLATGHLDPNVHRITGNPGQQGNPLDFTIMKSLATSEAITRNTAKRATIRQLLKAEPGNVADHVILKKGERVPEHGKPGYGWMTVREQGVKHAYLVPRQFIDAFSKADHPLMNKYAEMASDITYNIWHPLFVTYNPTFGVRNIFRDFNRSWNLMVAQGRRLQTEKADRLMAEDPTLTKKQAMALAKDQRISIADLIAARIEKAGSAWRVARGIDNYDDYAKRVIRSGALTTLFTDLPPSRKAGRPLELEMRKHGIDLNRRQSHTKIQKLLSFINLPSHIRTLNAFTEALPKMADFSVLDKRGVPDSRKAFLVRKLTGTPDIAQKGLLSTLTNSVFMYSKVRVNDLDSAYDMAFSKDTAASWWGHFVTMSLLPKIATVMALDGYFGDEVREIMSAIPEYYREAYNVVPLGWHTTKEGKRQAAALLAPQNELHAVLGTAAYRMLRGGDFRDLFNAMDKARPFSLSPPLKLAWWTMQIATGSNPADDLGRPVLDPTNFAASQAEGGGVQYLAADYLHMFLKTSGVGYDASWIMGIPQALGSTYEREGLEAFLKLPAVRSLVIVTDRGLHEAAMEANDSEFNSRAMARADLDSDTLSIRRMYYVLNRRYQGMVKQGKKMPDADWRRLRLLKHNMRYIDATIERIHAANRRYQNMDLPLEDRARAKSDAKAMYVNLAKRSARLKQMLSEVGK